MADSQALKEFAIDIRLKHLAGVESLERDGLPLTVEQKADRLELVYFRFLDPAVIVVCDTCGRMSPADDPSCVYCGDEDVVRFKPNHPKAAEYEKLVAELGRKAVERLAKSDQVPPGFDVLAAHRNHRRLNSIAKFRSTVRAFLGLDA